jgi:DNA repair protein RadC
MQRQNVLALGPGARDRFAALTPAALAPGEARSVVRLALAVLAERHRPGAALARPSDTRAYLRLLLGERKAEVFGALYLDERGLL